MEFSRAKPRGSKYSQKQIDPISIHIAFEGAEDEAKYFLALKQAIPKQFNKLLELIIVNKSSTASAPSKVYTDIAEHLKANKIKLNQSANPDHIAYMVIDKDHHFEANHVGTTRQALRYAKDQHIHIICNTPSFDLWLLCHYLDVANCDNSFKQRLIENNRTSHSSDPIIKQTLRQYRQSEPIQQLIEKTQIALEHEQALGRNLTDIPPQTLTSNVGYIIEKIQSLGITLTNP